jgi:hypothetical protein
MGQQKVNEAAPEHPRRSELTWLNHALRPAFPSRQKSPESTFNPKVAGSIPDRPIASSQDNQRAARTVGVQACRRTCSSLQSAAARLADGVRCCDPGIRVGGRDRPPGRRIRLHVCDELGEPLAGLGQRLLSRLTEVVRQLVAIIPVPMRTWETTSDHFRLMLSATTPVGTSNTSAMTPCATPISTS